MGFNCSLSFLQYSDASVSHLFSLHDQATVKYQTRFKYNAIPNVDFADRRLRANTSVIKNVRSTTEYTLTTNRHVHATVVVRSVTGQGDYTY